MQLSGYSEYQHNRDSIKNMYNTDSVKSTTLTVSKIQHWQYQKYTNDSINNIYNTDSVKSTTLTVSKVQH